MKQHTYSSEVSNCELNFIHDWVAAITGATSEQNTQDCWKTRIPAGVPISFQYGDRSSIEVLEKANWILQPGEWNNGIRSHILTATDTATDLVITVEIIEYISFPAVEWVIHFTNSSDKEIPAISKVSAIDLLWQTPGVVPILHRSRGSDERPDDFEYMSDSLHQLRMPSRTIHMDSGAGDTPLKQAKDGRSSVDWLPFFNLQSGDDGLAIAIGWTGQWEADFIHDGTGNVQVKAGMEFIDLKLKPGESIRTPRILALYWQDNPTHGENVLRQFMLTYHNPQENGKPAIAPFSHGSWGGSVTAEHMELIRKIKDHDLPYDYYWIDAGWYGTGTEPCPDVFHGDWGVTGDWQVNTNRHPDGLKPIRDAAREAGMKFLLWIEPLRATYNTPVTLEHPEWFLSLTGEPAQPGESLLLNLGHPGGCQWAIETVSKLVDEIGIDCYREDYNFFGSQQCFLRNDPPGRQGITEIRFVEGLYKFWDELLRRHPGLLIDNCASGGRRIDLETCSRSIALWRTDYNCFAPVNHDALQVHSAGLAHWVPLSGTSPSADPYDTYGFRSALSAASSFCIDEFGLAKKDDNDPDAWAWHRKMMVEFLRVRPYWYGDFYPLMSCSLKADTWMAYQLNRSDLGEGVVAAFRRAESPLATADFNLKGLIPNAAYEFEDIDTSEKWQTVSTDQGDANLNITIPTQRASKLLFYRKIS